MESLGHGSWLAIEQHVVERAGAERPLTVAEIQSAIAARGGRAPSNRAIREQLATDISPKGKTRDGYEKFWATRNCSLPLSDLVRLADVDDCEEYARLQSELQAWRRNADSKRAAPPRERKRLALARELHIFLRAQATKAAVTATEGSDFCPVEAAFQAHRCHFRFADLLFDAGASRLPTFNGWSRANERERVGLHFAKSWEAANAGRTLAAGIASKEDTVRKEGARLLQALFDIGAASAAEQSVALALVQKDNAGVRLWAGRLKTLLGEKNTRGFVIFDALSRLNVAFKKRRAMKFARYRVAYVMASWAAPVRDPASSADERQQLRNEIMKAIYELAGVIAHSDEPHGAASEERKRLAELPTFSNLVERGLVSKKEVEDAFFS